METIEVQGLTKNFGQVKALRGLSFGVEEGEIFGFLGPNGAGKTTTIRALMGFIKPTAGEIKILPLEEIGYLSGDVRLYSGWTGEDHLKFLEGIRGRPSGAAELMAMLNFNPKIKFHALSSGNKQKLGLILALAFAPKLLIMDEPTVGLDPLLQNTIYEVLKKIQAKGTTIFMSSHNLAEVERLCDRVGIIKEGKLVTVESIQAMKDKKMHVVRITFNGPYNQNEFTLPNIQVRQALPESLELGVSGDLNPLIRQLATLNLKELEITHASLEEIFLEFYGNNGKEEDVQSPLAHA